jgi:ABC-2 type transport system permease protein
MVNEILILNKMNRKDLKKQNIYQLLLSTAIILAICFISTYVFFRIDLTQEKRYTISPVSKNILKNLPDEVLIKVYLDGELPLGFKRLNSSVREMLDEFRVYAGNNVAYQFIDPYFNNDEKAATEFIKSLYGKGLKPTNVKVNDDKGSMSQKIIVPGLVIAYNGTEIPINLLNNNPALSSEQNINNAIQSLEYLLINNIKNITNKKVEKIAFLEGHGELDQYQTADITRELANYYQVDRGSINGNINAIIPYKVVIIAKPQTAFSEEDKFILDQYLMNGGKIAWFIDAVNVNTDSLVYGTTMAFIPQLNIEDQLFKYGIRINPVLVEDVQCSLIPINTSPIGGTPKFTPAPWMYYPLLNASAYHPLSQNVNLVKSEFCSYIDTLSTNGRLKNTVLLNSSQFSRLKTVPAFISLAEVKQTPQKNSFNKSELPVAIIAEGTFTSVFKNRMLSNLKVSGDFSFKEESNPTSMIVVADGDIIRNDVRNSAQGLLISPLGFDKYTNQTYGNKEFVLNAINYLTDEVDLMSLRTREIKLRLLDREKVKEEKTKWILFNTVFPVVIIILFGIVLAYYRKRKYNN